MFARNLLVLVVGLSVVCPLLAQQHQPLVRKYYDVADLLLMDTDNEYTVSSQQLTRASERLLRLIVASIEPQTWSGRGGAGTIEFVPSDNALVVMHTACVQNQVAELLNSLRCLAEPPFVAVPCAAPRVRTLFSFITLSEQQYQRLVDDGQLATGGVTHLSEPALGALLTRCQELQAVDVFSAPVLELREGEEQTRTFLVQTRHFVTGCQIVRGPTGSFTHIPTIEAFADKLGYGVRVVSIDQDDRVQLEVRSAVQVVHEDHWHRLEHRLPSRVGVGPAPFTQYLQNPFVSAVYHQTAVRLEPGQASVHVMDGTILQPLPAMPAWMAVGLGIDPSSPIRRKVLLVVRTCVVDECE